MDYHAVEEWLDDFVVLNGTKEMAACGLGVLEREKIGLFDIRVKDCYRRLGLGTEICRQIIKEGKKYGANEVYLQVASVNEGAIRLYEKLGFTNAYTYWYRVKGGEENQ